MMLFDIREGAKKKTKWTVKVVLEGLATGLGPCVCGLDVGLHVIEICLHVLHVNVVTYVIFLLHTGEFTCKIIYM